MIPPTINADRDATPGEKRVFRLLQDALLPDDDYLVWYEPNVMNRYTDFLIFSQKAGLLVMEVKDWVISNISSANPEVFTGHFYGRYQSVRNPLQQARETVYRIMELVKQVPQLSTKQWGKGRNPFPIGHCVCFTNIPRSAAEKKGLLHNNQILGTNQALFSDDLQFDTDDPHARRDFIAKLKKAFTIVFEFDPLTYPQLQALRYAIFPEVRVNTHKIRKLRTADGEALMRTLDLEQERTAKGIGEGHRIIKGVAGSGKTLVLACRARYLRQLHPDWNILIVCYNISLRQYLRQLLNSMQDGKGDDGIEIDHFHGLVKRLTGANLRILENEEQEAYDIRIGTILKGAIASTEVRRGLYHAILVDEGQDFVTEWMQGLSQLLNEESDSLLFCFDPAQNVFGKKKPNWKTAGFKVQGKKPTLLKKSYRNTVEILRAATIFARIEQQAAVPEENIIDATLFPDLETERHGPLPELSVYRNDEAMAEDIVEKISTLIRDQVCGFEDIGILYTEGKYFPNHLIHSFSKVFDRGKIYWATENREAKLNLDVSLETVKLLTIESCKGLEFRVVFLAGVDNLPRKSRAESIDRSLLYVGLTRAQDLLYLGATEMEGFAIELKAVLDGLRERQE